MNLIFVIYPRGEEFTEIQFEKVIDRESFSTRISKASGCQSLIDSKKLQKQFSRQQHTYTTDSERMNEYKRKKKIKPV